MPTSPCCTHLLLSDFQIATLLDIDHAIYLLNFEGIILGLGQDRKVDVYLYQPCGFLDVPSGLCTVHGTPIQPAVCVHYNAHSCSYRHRMTVDVDPERPLLDRHRMSWFADQVVFDDQRRVIAIPDWDRVLEAFRTMPLQRAQAPIPEPDPVVEEWRSVVLSEKRPDDGPGPVHHYADPEVSDSVHRVRGLVLSDPDLQPGPARRRLPTRVPSLLSGLSGGRGRSGGG